MKRIFFVVFLLLGCACSGSAQSGTWSSSIDVRGMKLSILFHLDAENPTMDVPDQSARGIPIHFETKGEGRISITIPAIAASYEGELKEGEIRGTFVQMGMNLPLTLRPGVQKLNRPQTPVGPFPYSEEEVSFSNGEAHLKGTLTLPNGYSRKTLALVMVTGSGLQNRDEELFEHKPFAVIADALARAGFATLRYDDRGFGESTGDVANATTDDLKADALAGIKFLRERFDKVGVLGHSEGGTIAMMLAAEGETDFIVSLAGMVVSGEETIIWQSDLDLSAAGIEQGDIEKYNALLREAFAALREGTTLPSAEGSDLPEVVKQSYIGLLQYLQTPYLKRFASLDMRPLLKNIHCPLLALNGTKDMQVEAESNLKALKEVFDGRNGSQIVAVEGVNHLFQHCTTGLVTEYRDIEETFAPEVLNIIIEWLLLLNPSSMPTTFK